MPDSDGKMVLSVNNPDSGSASEEIEVDYDSTPIEIGFNARYLLDIASQLSSDTALLKLSDPGSPTIIQDRDGSAESRGLVEKFVQSTYFDLVTTVESDQEADRLRWFPGLPVGALAASPLNPAVL